jgi:hypothetical protein
MESMQDNNKFDHEIKSKFDGFNPSVPAELWNKIESQLDDAEPNKPVKRVRFSYFTYGAVAASILIAFLFWKLGDTEELELQEDSVVYVSESPIERNEPLLDSKRDAEQAIAEVFVKTEHLEEVRGLANHKKTASDDLPLETIVAISDTTNYESVPKEVEYSIAFVETSDPLPLSENSIVIEQALPFQNEDISFQESISLEEANQVLFIKEEESQTKMLRVSTLLNLLAKGLSNESGKSIEFSESDEGILKLDIKLGLVKSTD